MKNRLKIVLAVIIALCASFSAIGCAEDDKEFYPFKVARQQFGCERILWYCGGHYCNNISGYYLEEGGGKFGKDHVFPMEGGYYVVGEDKDGNEIFMLIPFEKNAREGYKAVKYDWPFDYSFKEIATFAAEHGYKYANGIEDCAGKVLDESADRLFIYDSDLNINYCIKNIISRYGNAEKLYDSLDEKLLFKFTSTSEEGNVYDYFIVQQNGKMNLFKLNRHDVNDVCVITYERNAV